MLVAPSELHVMVACVESPDAYLEFTCPIPQAELYFAALVSQMPCRWGYNVMFERAIEPHDPHRFQCSAADAIEEFRLCMSGVRTAARRQANARAKKAFEDVDV